MPPSRLFCFGLGYSARRFAIDLMKKGWQVAGTAREDEGVEELKSLGIDAAPFDRDHPVKDLESRLLATTHLLSSVPPDAVGDPVLDIHGIELSKFASSLDWIGYLSTTGVYGNRDGGWVKEGDGLEPTSDRARYRSQAEARWLNLGAHAFRLAGIYGPGRNVLEDVRKGRAKRIDKKGHVFSRIHVDDIANVLKASIARPDPGTLYNVCDDEAAPPMDVVSHACELLKVTPPPVQAFEDAEKEMTAMGRTFWVDNKRVDNSRIKEDLGVKLLYPGYRQGLRAILEEEVSRP
jgi:nucleoside-diphosphate-sugar epimerase